MSNEIIILPRCGIPYAFVVARRAVFALLIKRRNSWPSAIDPSMLFDLGAVFLRSGPAKPEGSGLESAQLIGAASSHWNGLEVIFKAATCASTLTRAALRRTAHHLGVWVNRPPRGCRCAHPLQSANSTTAPLLLGVLQQRRQLALQPRSTTRTLTLLPGPVQRALVTAPLLLCMTRPTVGTLRLTLKGQATQLICREFGRTPGHGVGQQARSAVIDTPPPIELLRAAKLHF